MSTHKFFLKSGTSGCAVFEVGDSGVLVSATLGFSSMIYKSEMSVEKAREQYKKLLDKGWNKISTEEAQEAGFSHNYVWEFYN